MKLQQKRVKIMNLLKPLVLHFHDFVYYLKQISRIINRFVIY